MEGDCIHSWCCSRMNSDASLPGASDTCSLNGEDTTTFTSYQTMVAWPSKENKASWVTRRGDRKRETERSLFAEPSGIGDHES